MYGDDFSNRRTFRNPMATASVILGILALTSCSIFYLALPCGALAVIFAILSRDRQITKRGIAGIVCGLIGIILSVSITVYAVFYVLTSESGRAYLEYYYQMYTGDYDFDLDEVLDGLFGSDSSSEGEEKDLNDDDSDTDNRVPDGNNGSDNPDDSRSGEGGFV